MAKQLCSSRIVIVNNVLPGFSWDDVTMRLSNWKFIACTKSILTLQHRFIVRAIF